MQSKWPVSTGFAGALVLAAGAALAQPAPPMLTDRQARDPAAVVRWLQTHKLKDMKDVQWFFQQGLREKRRGNWSAAVKSFGESMTRYPAPLTLAEYADTQLQMLAQVRKRDDSVQDHMQADMALTRDYYRAALAANTVLGTLSEQEQAGIQDRADCLGTYLATGQANPDCQPLQYYAPTP